MLLYLDNSVLNRPFDDQRQPRIWLETLSFSLVLSLVESGEATLVCSFAHQVENHRNPFPQRKRWVEKCLSQATVRVELSQLIKERAQGLERVGLKPLDALHVASAEDCGAGLFLTCDDQLLRRYSGQLKLQTPVNWITELA